jgi:hypothetical protein
MHILATSCERERFQKKNEEWFTKSRRSVEKEVIPVLEKTHQSSWSQREHGHTHSSFSKAAESAATHGHFGEGSAFLFNHGE